MAPTLLLFFTFLVQAFCTTRAAPPKFTAILTFGDSLLDTGTNNYVGATLRADHKPYGGRFPGGPTGRFTDGRMMSDFVASTLKIKETVPTFLNRSLSNDDLRTGANFASAGAGYDDITSIFSGSIPVSKQVGMFQNYVKKLEGAFGEKEAKKIVNGALMIVSSASNDVSLNYYAGGSRSREFTIEGYHEFLQNKLANYLKELHSLGVRNILIAGLPPLGNWPANRLIGDKINTDSMAYNAKLVTKIPKIQASLPGSKVVYADMYTPLKQMFSNPQKFGYTETKKGCCGSGLDMGISCNEQSQTCPDSNKFMFWDAAHPGEVAYKYVAQSWLRSAIPRFN